MNKIIKSFKEKIIKNDQVKFKLMVGLKFALIPTFTILFTIIINYIVLRVSMLSIDTFESEVNVIAKDVLSLYFQKVLLDLFPWIGIAFSLLILLGVFVANVLLRPFVVIGNHCENILENKKSSYDPEFLTDLRLLSAFSEWFFNTLSVLKASGELHQVSVPEKFKKIHKPVFETSFFIHNFLIIIITCFVTGLLLQYGNFELSKGVSEILNGLYKDDGKISRFLNELDHILWVSSNIGLFINFLSYMLFMFYLYSCVSVPAFGVFATMRSFVSGKHSSRVHLIGFSYIRKHTRILNKYLDYVEKEYSSKEN